ncbi:uncharacterized protein LOC129302786 [Prosopis cineraria]|uniref:uncharacterized protein LOC129302786 n=1 Tax=Prosopis cineraria TaxID=364024 RepID=UPI00240FD1FA|nr:uncharacterized protein LOC129302786 [Prosopis cineraria]
MGNAVLTPCFVQQNPTSSSSSSIKLVFCEGTTRFLTGKHVASEIMFEFPDKMVCHADSFFMGLPVPSLAIDDELMPGQTYFILPIDRSACKALSPAWLAALGSSSTCPNKTSKPSSLSPCPIKFGENPSPFEYIKGSNGRVLIKVKPEFITRLINGNNDKETDRNGDINYSFLCSTPELKKHYDRSPKLETISEYKVRFSPCRFLGLEWKEKEKNVYESISEQRSIDDDI